MTPRENPAADQEDEREREALRIFEEVSEAGAADREEQLAARTGGDADLHRRVLELLAADSSDFSLEPDGGFRQQLEELVEERESLALEDPSTSLRRVHHYRLEELLGTGGMSVVYRARDEKLGRDVALKVLRQAGSRGIDGRRFRREAKLLAALQHRNVVGILDSGEFETPLGSHPYFVMELVSGQPLTLHMEQSQATLAARLSLMAEICDGIDYAHQRGIIHRDLKPDNILVGTDDRGQAQAKILDFGVSKVIGDAPPLSSMETVEGLVLGTVAYMSPEQADGRAAEADTRTDIHALGALAFELITGDLAYEIQDLSLPQALQKIASSSPPRLGSINLKWRGDLEVIVAKALARDREDRYARASDLGEDLRAYLREEPIRARSASSLYSLHKFARRNRRLVALVLGIFLLLVISLALTLASRARAERASEDAQQRAAELTAQIYRSRLSTATHLANRMPVVALMELEKCPEEVRGWEWERVRAQMDRVLLDAALASDESRLVSLLADGRLLVQEDDRSLATIRVPDGKRELFYRHESALRGVAANSSGNRLLLLTVKGEALSLDGSTATVLKRETWAPVGRVQSLLYDGERAAVVTDWVIEAFADGVAKPFRSRSIKRKDLLRIRLLHFEEGGRSLVLSEKGRRTQGHARWGRANLETRRITWHRPSPRSLAIAVHPRAEQVAFGAPERDIFLRTPDGERRVVAHLGYIDHLLFSGSGRILASESNDSTVRIWETDTAQQRCVLELRGRAQAMRFSNDETRLAVAYQDRVRVWDIRRERNVLRGHEDHLQHVDVSPCGTLATSTGSTGSVCLWDLETGQLLKRTRHRGMLGASFSEDGERLVGATRKPPELLTWQWADDEGFESSGPSVSPHEAFKSLAQAIDPHRSRPLRLSRGVSVDALRTLMWREGAIFDWENGSELFRAPGDRGGLSAGSFLPDGRLLQTHFMIRLIDPKDWSVSQLLTTHRTRIFSTACSRNGGRIATGGNDSTIQIWDGRTLRELVPILDHHTYVMGLCFSPDGSFLISCSGDATVRIFDTLAAPERWASPERTLLRTIAAEVRNTEPDWSPEALKRLRSRWPQGDSRRIAALRTLLLKR